MVLGSRIRRTPIGPPSADGTGITGGPNAKSGAQEAHYRETLKVEASVIELLSKMQITLGDPRVQLYTSAVLTGPINLPLPTTPAVLEEDIPGGKRRRGVAVNTSPAPAVLITPSQPPSISNTYTPSLPLSSSALPSTSSSPSLGFLSSSPSPAFPSSLPVFPSSPTSVPVQKTANPLTGTFEGLGFLVNDLDVPDDDEMSLPFRHPGLRMEDWWYGLPSGDRLDIAQFLVDGSGLPLEIVLRACMDKFQLTYLQCSWAREFTAMEEKGQPMVSPSSPILVKAPVDMSFSSDVFTLNGHIEDGWGDTCSSEVFVKDEIPRFEDENYNLNSFHYDDDMLSSLPLTSEVPLGPTPYQNALPSLFLQSPLSIKYMDNVNVLSMTQPLSNGFGDGSASHVVGPSPFPAMRGNIAHPSPLPESMVTQTNIPAVLSQTTANGQPGRRKSHSVPVEKNEERLTERQLFARAHEQELLNTKHPAHKQTLFDWHMMEDPEQGDEAEKARNRKSRPNFGKEAYEPLRTWFVSKIPGIRKPTKQEKKFLQDASGLTAEQIVRWISNNRTRLYEPKKDALDELASQRDCEKDIRQRAVIEAAMYKKLFTK